MLENGQPLKKTKTLRKITPQRLKNIALYYLKRFDSSVANLRSVLRRRVEEYAYFNKEFDKHEAYAWIESILEDFESYGYLNDERYGEIKVRNYLAAGKSARYIQGKMKQKGISEQVVDELLENSGYDAYESALALAKKKKIGPFRAPESRREMRNKDMAALIRAGFDYDVVCKIMGEEGLEAD